ncbi:MAG TPA: DUF1203 domain-containing protein [Sphingomicrobium sp.]|nr:DUF1203 domain-containing protein [Sphingomicrobium sp.]
MDPGPFEPLFGLPDEELAARGVVRMTATQRPGFPCRVTLDDASPGETVLLLNHVSHDVANPYRAAHAIFVREGAAYAPEFIDEVPPVLGERLLSLRAFGACGMMVDAALAQPGEADTAIRRLFDSPRTAYIHAHNAVRGCFAAAVERA